MSVHVDEGGGYEDGVGIVGDWVGREVDRYGLQERAKCDHERAWRRMGYNNKSSPDRLVMGIWNG
jgi:hypothetical protein